MSPHQFEVCRQRIHELVGRLDPSLSVVVLSRPFGAYDVEIIGARGSYVIALDEDDLASVSAPTEGGMAPAIETRFRAGVRTLAEA